MSLFKKLSKYVTVKTNFILIVSYMLKLNVVSKKVSENFGHNKSQVDEEVMQKDSLLSTLAFIQCHLIFFPVTITELEKTILPLTAALSVLTVGKRQNKGLRLILKSLFQSLFGSNFITL